MFASPDDLRAFLDQKVAQYNQKEFIAHDPISIPHLFSKKQDIEIMGFWAAILAWGQRKTIINKCKELIELMDGCPYDFICHHEDSDLKRLLGFKHRTFNATDTLYFIQFFKQHYQNYESLESAFFTTEGQTMEQMLNQFRINFFAFMPDYLARTKKHIAAPSQKSACKRINMFLRWMVRNDTQGVDFGLWKNIKPSQLVCPIDVHVERVARKLGLIERKNLDWITAVELTEQLKTFDAQDPVKYDFALFGLGVEEGF
jgi:uncharacterized protein (TIGR02757 family)